MNTYTIIVEGCRWYTVTAQSFEAAWLSERVWFNNNEMLVMNNTTRETKYFRR